MANLSVENIGKNFCFPSLYKAQKIKHHCPSAPLPLGGNAIATYGRRYEQNAKKN